MEQGFEIGIIFKVFKDYWKIIVAIALIFAVCAFLATTFLAAPQYQTTFKLLIINNNNSDFAQQAIVAANDILGEIYAELSKSDEVISYIKEDISEKWEVTDALIRQSLNAKSTDSGFLSYNVTTVDPELSQDIAVSASRIIPDYLERSGYGARVEVINHAGNAVTVSNAMLYTAISFIAGAFLTWLLFFVRMFFNTAIETKKDMETYFSYPVLGEIPSWGKD